MVANGVAMADGRDEPAVQGPYSPASSQDGSFAPFRFPAFRNVWSANVLSQIGSQIQLVGAGWLMTELTSEHRMVAAVQAASPLSMLLLSVLAGGVADNFDRRRVMLAAQWFMLLVSAALAVQAWLGMLQPWSLLTFSLLVGAGMTMQMPAWQASVRTLVDSRVLPQAISLNSIAFNLARTVGPAIGGIVLAMAGVSIAFAINALSYVAMIVVFTRWQPSVAPPLRNPLLPSIMAGARYVFGSSPLRRLIFRGAAYASAAMALQALLPVVVREGIHGNASDYGLMLGAFGVGSVAGALLSQKLRRAGGAELTIGVATACATAALAGLAIVHTVLTAIPFTFIGGVGWTTCLTTLNVGTQLRSRDDMLGRSMAIYQAVTFGMAAIAAWCWGMLSDLVGIRITLAVASATLVASGMVLRFLLPMPARGEGVLLSRN